MLVTVLLLGFVLVASATDVLWHKIYNWTTYSGIATALALSAATTRWTAIGAVPLIDSVAGLLLCGATMIVCFVFFRGIGGGDVKLVAMMGAFLGADKGLEAMLWTFVLGACMGMIVLVWRVGPLATMSRVGRLLATAFRLGWFQPLSDEERQSLRPPVFLAPAGLAAAIIVRFSLIG